MYNTSEHYADINARVIDNWVENGWEWGQAIDHETYLKAKDGQWNVFLTPTKPVPRAWLGSLLGKKVLGLASGGGQQMPIFQALGAECTVLDYSEKQLEQERMVAQREGYEIEIIRADMTKPLPFAEKTFDLIFHPVSNCYVEQMRPILRECFRILKPGGVFVAGFDNGMNFILDDDEHFLKNTLPFNPLKNSEQRRQLEETNGGMQFSHTTEELIGGQLEAGFRLTHLYEDTNGRGPLHEHGVPTFLATRAVRPQ